MSDAIEKAPAAQNAGWFRAGVATCCAAALAVGLTVAAKRGSAGQTWLETLHFAGLFVLTLAVLFLRTGGVSTLGRAAARILLAAITIALALALYPPFHFLAAGQGSGETTLIVKLLPIAACVIAWGISLRRQPLAIAAGDASERLETFLMRPGVRINLFLLALFALPAMAWMSGMAAAEALWPAAFLGALLLALDFLFHAAGTKMGAWVLCGFVLAASAAAAFQGFRVYFELDNATLQAIAGTENGRAEEAKLAYDRALELSKTLRTNGPRVEMETGMARVFEKQNNPAAALAHWQNVALLSKINPSAFAPLRRIKCALGDSLPAWRLLVFQGFPAISDPEVAPGVMKLADNAPDVRAKLLAALLAWDSEAPEAERRKLLEAVQKVSPGEPSSLNLLKRMGGTVKDVPMWLPPDLIVGTVPTYQSALGTIEELGEVCTVVCLNAGHWEMSLRVAGTPLHEEWPVVRVEMNGQPLATTQVNKAAEYDVPFTFDVTRSDIFKVRIVFQNHLEDLEEGHAAVRGLKIMGIKFSHAKE